jgi:hypothetical protein
VWIEIVVEIRGGKIGYGVGRYSSDESGEPSGMESTLAIVI